MFDNNSKLNKDVLLGTIIGDVVGSRFELVNNKYGKQFEMFHKYCRYTDDTVMTLAVAKALLESKEDYSDIEEKSIKYMLEVGRKYPNCGYGPKFYQWLMTDNHEPYGSFGNGAAMRISPVGVISNDINLIKTIAKKITNVSHNHKDSIIGSEVVCLTINMALNNKSKKEIQKYIKDNYFDVKDLKIDSMKSPYFHINCVETVKQSLSAFFEAYDFEDAIRNAIALGGDSDTIAAITGGIAAAYYGIPKEYCDKVKQYLDDYLLEIYNHFMNKQYIKTNFKLKKKV